MAIFLKYCEMFPTNRSGRSPDRPRARARSARTTAEAHAPGGRGGAAWTDAPRVIDAGPDRAQDRRCDARASAPAGPPGGRAPAGLGGGVRPDARGRPRRAARAGRRPARACPSRVHRDVRPPCGRAGGRGGSSRAARVAAADGVPSVGSELRSVNGRPPGPEEENPCLARRATTPCRCAARPAPTSGRDVSSTRPIALSFTPIDVQPGEVE